jgi:heterodisulfide reductase subunit A-like polyferredoxin
MILGTFLVALWGVLPAVAEINPSQFDPKDTIQKDVVIIGGGASGAHAAVRLREDFKKSVVVVERQSLLVIRITRRSILSSRK